MSLWDLDRNQPMFSTPIYPMLPIYFVFGLIAYDGGFFPRIAYKDDGIMEKAKHATPTWKRKQREKRLRNQKRVL